MDQNTKQQYQTAVNHLVAGDTAATAAALKQIIADKTKQLMGITESHKLLGSCEYDSGQYPDITFKNFDFDITVHFGGADHIYIPTAASVHVSAGTHENTYGGNPQGSYQSIDDFSFTSITLSEMTADGDDMDSIQTLDGEAAVRFSKLPGTQELWTAVSNCLDNMLENKIGGFDSDPHGFNEP